jgi:hypothetical protein
MRQGLKEWQAIGIEFAHPFFRSFIAEAYKKVG